MDLADLESTLATLGHVHGVQLEVERQHPKALGDTPRLRIQGRSSMGDVFLLEVDTEMEQEGSKRPTLSSLTVAFPEGADRPTSSQELERLQEATTEESSVPSFLRNFKHYTAFNHKRRKTFHHLRSSFPGLMESSHDPQTLAVILNHRRQQTKPPLRLNFRWNFIARPYQPPTTRLTCDMELQDTSPAGAATPTSQNEVRHRFVDSLPGEFENLVAVLGETQAMEAILKALTTQ